MLNTLGENMRENRKDRTEDQRGAVLIMVALALGVLVLATAFSIDIGRESAENRRLQAIADSAASDGAQAMGGGGQYSDKYTPVYNAVMLNASRNGIHNPEDVFSVELGNWSSTTQTFTPATSGLVTAVRVTMHDSFSNLFAFGSQSLKRAGVATSTGGNPSTAGPCTGPCTTSTVCTGSCTVVTTCTGACQPVTCTGSGCPPTPGGTTTCTGACVPQEQCTANCNPQQSCTGPCNPPTCTGAGCPPPPHPEEAGFSIGSYGVAIQSNCGSSSTAATCVPALVLNGLLNSSLGITGVGYQGLAASSITLNGLLAANPTIGSLNALLTSTFTGPQFGTIVANAIQYCESGGSGCNSSSNLASFNSSALKTAFTAGGSTTTAVGCPVSPDCFVYESSGSPSSAGSANINLADLVFGGAVMFDGGHAISLNNLGVSVSGLSSASASLSLISPLAHYRGPVQDPATAPGTPDAQGNGTLTLNLTGIPNASNVVVTLPFTLAQAVGWLQDLQCQGGPNNPPTAFKVYATTSGASVGASGGGNVNLTVASIPINGTTTGAVGGSSAATLTFSAPYPAASQSINGNTAMPALSVTLHTIGNPVVDPLLPGIQASIQTTLNNVLNPVLSALSQSAGISAGNATVIPDNSVQCQPAANA